MGQIGHPDSVKISHSHWGKSDMAKLGQIGHNAINMKLFRMNQAFSQISVVWEFV